MPSPLRLRYLLVACLLGIIILRYSWTAQSAPPHADYMLSGNSSDFIDQTKSASPSSVLTGAGSPNPLNSSAELPCKAIKGADEVLVVLKTGATEVKKVSLLLNTTLLCAKHHVIFSDCDDVVENTPVLNILNDIDDDIKDHHEDFEFYQKIQYYHKDGKGLDELMAKESEDDRKGWDRKGWRLDKWKFMPMIEGALRARPNAKWYFFLETDTYVMWPMLLRLLAQLDASKPLYAGSVTSVEGLAFAHGGSGFLFSGATMRQMGDIIATDKKRFLSSPKKECCGDYVLGRFNLKQLDLKVHDFWPIFQGETPASRDYTRELWCSPVMTWHHVSPEERLELWNFEKKWFGSGSSALPVLHRDIFDAMVLPRMQKERRNWDGVCLDRSFTASTVTEKMKPEEKVAHTSMVACREACVRDPKCKQYSYQPGPVECRFGYVIRLGTATMGTNSGWITERITAFKDMMADKCTTVRWRLPTED